MEKITSSFKQAFFLQKAVPGSKVFCIGQNKTGTTSTEKLLRELGYSMGSQHQAELLLDDWAKNDFKKIIDFVRNGGQAFQDIPFSLPKTYEVLDKAFPGSKFILTIRDSAEVWYRSLTTYHAQLFGGGKIPQKKDLVNAKYVYPGWMWEACTCIYKTPEDDPYNKKMLTDHYNQYNADVINYFQNDSSKLLVINIKEPDASVKIAEFLGAEKEIKEMPWVNKTEDLMNNTDNTFLPKT